MSIRDQNVTKITRHYRQMDFHRELDVSKFAFSIRAYFCWQLLLIFLRFTNFQSIFWKRLELVYLLVRWNYTWLSSERVILYELGNYGSSYTHLEWSNSSDPCKRSKLYNKSSAMTKRKPCWICSPKTREVSSFSASADPGIPIAALRYTLRPLNGVMVPRYGIADLDTWIWK